MTSAEFRELFPEFARTPEALVQAHLDGATAELSATTFGTLLDEAIGYLSAHRIALSPSGAGTRLTPGSSPRTTYLEHYERLLRRRAMGARVV